MKKFNFAVNHVGHSESSTVICPVCKKILVRNPSANSKTGKTIEEIPFSPCEHVALWFNNSDDSFVHIAKNPPSPLQAMAKKADGDETAAMKVFKKFEKIFGRENIVIRHYSEYLGGCCYNHDFVAFWKHSFC